MCDWWKYLAWSLLPNWQWWISLQYCLWQRQMYKDQSAQSLPSKYHQTIPKNGSWSQIHVAVKVIQEGKRHNFFAAILQILIIPTLYSLGKNFVGKLFCDLGLSCAYSRYSQAKKGAGWYWGRWLTKSFIMLAILRYSSFVNILTYWQTFLLDGNNLSTDICKKTRNSTIFCNLSLKSVIFEHENELNIHIQWGTCLAHNFFWTSQWLRLSPSFTKISQFQGYWPKINFQRSAPRCTVCQVSRLPQQNIPRPPGR